MRRDLHITTGERRGVIIVALITVIVAGVTLCQKCTGSDTEEGGEYVTLQRMAVSADSVIIKDRVKAAGSSKKKVKNNKRNTKHKPTGRPTKAPAERLFLEEQQ